MIWVERPNWIEDFVVNSCTAYRCVGSARLMELLRAGLNSDPKNLGAPPDPYVQIPVSHLSDGDVRIFQHSLGNTFPGYGLFPSTKTVNIWFPKRNAWCISVDLTDKVGVDMNRATTDNHYKHLLPFVCGLGFPKAEALIKRFSLWVEIVINSRKTIY
ncbi:hypothetical protein BDZ89DRAFT_1129811 [Hymenopellis radicata]|nr:hypothetical protein BDZ89DRAFT_1129811 [Hymenopellis radicata]